MKAWNDKYTEELNKLFKEKNIAVEKILLEFRKKHEEIAVRFCKEKDERWLER